MNFQWLELRISEEKDRRSREEIVRARLPLAMEHLGTLLSGCVAAFNEAFRDQSASIHANRDTIRISVRHERQGAWCERSAVTVNADPALPGFTVTSGAEPKPVQVGILSGDKLFYKYEDRYLSEEELSKLVLDRAFFPDLEQ